MIDHITIAVTSYARSKEFYTKALAPLGYGLVMEPRPIIGGFGKDQKPTLWIVEGRPSYWNESHGTGASPIHVALAATSRAAVDAFHAAALAAGGKDFGAPGVRPIYHAEYYGAFILDPDGNNLEAVIHGGS